MFQLAALQVPEFNSAKWQRSLFNLTHLMVIKATGRRRNLLMYKLACNCVDVLVSLKIPGFVRVRTCVPVALPPRTGHMPTTTAAFDAVATY